MIRWILCSVLITGSASAADVFRNSPFTTTPLIERTGRDWSEIASFPFNKVGCYPSGSAVGTRGETITITRASVAGYVDPDGHVGTCANNEARVSCDPRDLTMCGLVSEEGSSTQLYPTPLAPAAGTATIAVTGWHVFWVGGGSGSQTITNAGGTVSATNLPCTATATSPCAFSVTSRGATPVVTFGGVTGTLTMAQLEAVQYPTTIIPAAGLARATEMITIANPIYGQSPAVLHWWIAGTIASVGHKALGYNMYGPWDAGTLPNAGSWRLDLSNSGYATSFGIYQSGSVKATFGSSNALQSWPIGQRMKLVSGAGAGCYACYNAWGSPVGAVTASSLTTLPAALATFRVGWASGAPCNCYLTDLRIGRGVCRR